jgi:hypothetical protein
MAESKDHRITLQQATELTHAYQAAHKGEVRAWWFAREAFDALLAEPGAAGIRIYLGAGPSGPTPVICPTDGEGHDMTSGFLAEFALPCPYHCDDRSPLLYGS